MRVMNNGKQFFEHHAQIPFNAMYDRTVLLEGINAAECEQKCGNVIEWQDADGITYDTIQPQGFQCDCGSWSCNECGIREQTVCRSCIKDVFRRIA